MHISTFPTPREATIFFDKDTTASRANQTLRQILEKNPLLKNLDMFKEELTTQSYSYKVDPTWDKEPLVVFGRAPKLRKKLDPERWHMNRGWRAYGAKTVESEDNKASFYDNFGEDYQKFNASEFQYGMVEVTDAAHTYPPMPTRVITKPIASGVTTHITNSTKLLSTMHGVETFYEKTTSTTSSTTPIPSTTKEIFITPSNYQEFSYMTPPEYKLYTAPLKIVESTEEIPTYTGRKLADEEGVMKLLEEREKDGEYINEEMYEEIKEEAPFLQTLGTKTTTMPFIVTEKLMTMLAPITFPTPASIFENLAKTSGPQEITEISTVVFPTGVSEKMFTSLENNQLFQTSVTPTEDPEYSYTTEPEEVESETNDPSHDDSYSYPTDPNGDRIEEVEPDETNTSSIETPGSLDPSGSRIEVETIDPNDLDQSFETKVQDQDKPYDTRWIDKSDPTVKKWSLTAKKSDTAAKQLSLNVKELSPVAEKSDPIAKKWDTATKQLSSDVKESSPVAEKSNPIAEELSPASKKSNPTTNNLSPTTTNLNLTTTNKPMMSIFIQKIKEPSEGSTPQSETSFVQEANLEKLISSTLTSSLENMNNFLETTHLPSINPTRLPGFVPKYPGLKHVPNMTEIYPKESGLNMTGNYPKEDESKMTANDPDEDKPKMTLDVQKSKNSQMSKFEKYSKPLIEGGKRELQPISNEEVEEALENMNIVREEEVVEEEEGNKQEREYYLSPSETTDSHKNHDDTTPYFTEQLMPQFGTVHVTTYMPSTRPRLHQQSLSYSGSPEGPKFIDQKVSYGEFGRDKPGSNVVYDPNIAKGKYDIHQSKVKVISHSYFVPSHDNKNKKLNPNFFEDKASQTKGKLKTISEIKEVKHNPIKKPNYHALHEQKTLNKDENQTLTTTPFKEITNPVMNPFWRTHPAGLIHFPVFKPLSKAFAVAVQTHGIKNLQELMEPEKPKIETLEPMEGNPLKWGPRRVKQGSIAKLIPLSENKQELEKITRIHEIEKEVQNYGANDAETSKELYEKAIEKCFKIVNNCLIANVSPIKRTITGNKSECIDFCANHTNCLSLTYTESMSVCDIYNVKNGTNTTHMLRFLGYTYYEPKFFPISECLLNKTSRAYNSKTHINQENQEVSLAPKTFPNIGDTLSNVINNLLSQPVIVTSDDTGELQELEKLQELKTTTAIFTPETTAAPNSVDEQSDRDAFCPGDKDIAIFKSEGYRLRNFGIDGYEQNSTESECVFSCFINLAEGDHPYECVSSSYNRRRRECNLHPQGSNIQGNGHLQPDPTYNQYEKTCILSKIVEHCKGFPIIRQPQKTLIGYTISANTANNLVDCLELCYMKYLKDQSCKSIMYFYEETIHNCLLNSESERTQPEFFVDEVEVIVDYASFDECFDINKNPDLYAPSTRVSDNDSPHNLNDLHEDPTLDVERATTVKSFYKTKKYKIESDSEPYGDEYNSFKVDSEEGVDTNDIRRFRRRLMKKFLRRSIKRIR
uniref:Apple domain-containing protein n=1 Tax=Acrobeloides nanus TaxID=290746 RepID=A0A914DHC7_9BILA